AAPRAAGPMGLPKSSTGASGLLVVCIVIYIVDQYLDIIIGIAFNNPANAREHAVIVDTDQGDALCGTAHLADLGNARTNQYPARSDQHDFVGWAHQYGSYDLAVTG